MNGSPAVDAAPLWLLAITMFLDHPETVNLRPKALIARLNAENPGRKFTTKMLYRPLCAADQQILALMLAHKNPALLARLAA